MSKIKISENQEKYIRDNANRMMTVELAQGSGLSKWMVGQWMRENNVSAKKVLCKAKKDQTPVKEGCFDFNDKRNYF